MKDKKILKIILLIISFFAIITNNDLKIEARYNPYYGQEETQRTIAEMAQSWQATVNSITITNDTTLSYLYNCGWSEGGYRRTYHDNNGTNPTIGGLDITINSRTLATESTQGDISFTVHFWHRFPASTDRDTYGYPSLTMTFTKYIGKAPDITAPTLTLTPNATSWTRGDVIINVNASDSGSGVKNIKMPDGSFVNSSSTNYTISTNGIYTFTTYDNVNKSTTKTITINNIDKTAPTGNITPNTTNWTNQGITLTATSEDTQSGVKSITKPDGTIINGNTTNYIANTNGNYYFIITDNVGNIFTKSYTVTNIDKTLPKLNLKLDSDLITNKTVTINATALDEESRIKSITKPDGTVINGTSTTYTVDKNDTYVFNATDIAGNVITVSITVNNIIAINTISGIDHIEYKLEGATTQDWTTYNSLAIVNEGITTVHARAVDKAGNYSDVATSVVKLDRKVPIDTTIRVTPY